MKLLLHCCCAPCAVACINNLADNGITPSLFWYNPNIHPFTEYQSRRDALIAFAAAKELCLEMDDEYGLRSFLQCVHSKTETPERCGLCYRLRLEKTAVYAAEHGFDSFSTSLLISPYQQHEVIRRIGEELAAHYGVLFLYRDFRSLFREGQSQARALGLYMQKYCGCIFSEAEKREKKKEKRDIEHIVTRHINDKQRTLIPSSSFVIPHFFQRMALITGAGVLEKLQMTTVLVFGVGGVGSWCAEALVRSGVRRIGIVDFDTVCASNVNRQVQATSRTLGRVKVDALKERLLDINPNCEVTTWGTVFSRESAGEFGIGKADYVIDAIDSLAHKLDLIEIVHNTGTPLFSSMGMAQKMDPTLIKTAGIWETHGCPLARLVRHGLRKRGFNGSFAAVYSSERLQRHDECAGSDEASAESPVGKKAVNGSAVTVTATAGMILASLVLRDVMGSQ